MPIEDESTYRVVTELAASWGLSVGDRLQAGTESLVWEVACSDGRPAVLKVVVPSAIISATDLATEHAVLTAADGRGCVRLLRSDLSRGALLLERLGRALVDLDLDVTTQLRTICGTLTDLWRTPPVEALPSGSQHAARLASTIGRIAADHSSAVSAEALALALRLAERRGSAHDPSRAVVCHGDAHQWNTLQDPAEPTAFRFVDPDGIFAERELDVAVMMRELSAELLDGDPIHRAGQRAAYLADLTGSDPRAIWEWALVLNVENGLLWHQSGNPAQGQINLDLAEAWSGSGVL